MAASKKEMRRIHAFVSGTVQGVGYRYFVYEQAQRFDCTGWVRNIASGQVELEVQTATVNLVPFFSALMEGPRMAYVTNIDRTALDLKEGERGFEVR